MEYQYCVSIFISIHVYPILLLFRENCCLIIILFVFGAFTAIYK